MRRETIEKVADELGWNVTFDDEHGDVEFETWSPAGEDIVFSVKEPNIVNELHEFAESFDKDEHVMTMLEAKENGFQGVPSAYTLAVDADAIQTMLSHLSEVMRDAALKENRGEKFENLDELEDDFIGEYVFTVRMKARDGAGAMRILKDRAYDIEGVENFDWDYAELEKTEGKQEN